MAIENYLNIWDRVLTGGGDLSAESAKYLVGLTFGRADLDRVAALGAAANAGTLTTEERAELDDYLRIGTHLARLQSRARVALRGAAPVAAGHG